MTEDKVSEKADEILGITFVNTSLTMKKYKMKKTLLSFALASMACASMAQQKCQITGHLDNADYDSLYVRVTDKDYARQERIDTIAVKNGDFGYSIECDQMRLLQLVPVKGDLRSSMQNGAMPVLAMPGERAVISGNAQEFFFSGSKFYEDYNEYDRLTTPVNTKISNLQAEFMKRVEAKENEDSVRKDISAKYESYTKELTNIAKNFIKGHPSSHLSGYLLAYLPADERTQYASLVTDDVKNGATSPFLKATEKREAAEKARQEAAKKIQPGMAAPDFSLNDINGKPLALSSLRGKYVVLDFWGSWCIWCIKGMPKMKEYYEKYKGKFEILGIDCRDTPEQWKAAIEKHQLPWLHVYNPKDGDVTKVYAIQGYPTKIVVDPDGKIAKVVVGEDPAFYTYLDELLSK